MLIHSYKQMFFYNFLTGLFILSSLIKLFIYAYMYFYISW